jgi:hypothetical protein
MNTSTPVFNFKKIILGCMLLIICNIVFAQPKTAPVKKKTGVVNSEFYKWAVNLNGGSTQYWGYINSRNVGTTLRHSPTYGYGLELTRQITPIFGITGQFTMGTLKGRKDLFSNDSSANLLYSSKFMDFSLSARISLTDLFLGIKPQRKLNVYGIVGLGLANIEGRTINYYTFDTVHAFGYGSGKGIKGYELDGMATVGIGLKMKIRKGLDLTFENSMRFIHENKLNEVNGFLPSDLYGYSSLGISYNFGLKKTTKPVVAEKKPDAVKKEVAPVTAPVKTEVKKEPVATPPAPVKKEVVATPTPPVKQEPVKPIEQGTMFTGYKVQIIATMKAASFDALMQEYYLKEQIREDHVDQWYRYSVGEFQTYQQANAYKKILILRNKVKGAFVVKIVNGRRVGPVWK